MSKKIKLTENKFVPSDKILATKEGRTNFATCTQKFLSHAELINKGTGELSDLNAKYKDDLAKAENKLSNYLKGNVINSDVVAVLTKAVDDLKEEKTKTSKTIREYMPAMTDADKNLYVAYYWYQTEPQKEKYNGEFMVLYKRAFMEWFDSFGMVMGTKDFDFFSTKLGLKKASNKTYRKSGATQFTDVLGVRQFVELLYGIIIELMIKKGIIESYKLSYVADDENKPAVGGLAPDTEEPATEEPTAEEVSTDKPAEEEPAEDTPVKTIDDLGLSVRTSNVLKRANLSVDDIVKLSADDMKALKLNKTCIAELSAKIAELVA